MRPAAVGCIEAGGTKFICGVAREGSLGARRARIDTTTPDETLREVVAWFRSVEAEEGPFAAFGVASFGPVELDPKSPLWGSIRKTPKPGWSGTPLARLIGEAFNAPVGFDTDVNAAALAEAEGADGLVVYVTVGTGIGGGAVQHGRPLHGLRHAEMGHMRLPRHPLDSAFAGTCPFHGDCLEGLTSGPAIIARWGRQLSDLPAGHAAHEIIAWYLAQLCTNLLATLSPHRIAFGGGVMKTAGLIDAVRSRVRDMDSGYLAAPEDIASIIAPTRLGDDAGLHGARLLAEQALASATMKG